MMLAGGGLIGGGSHCEKGGRVWSSGELREKGWLQLGFGCFFYLAGI